MISAFHSRNFTLLALFSFVAIGIFCPWSTTAMNMGSSSDYCTVYGSEVSLCGTNVQSHISVWQNFLNVIPQKTFSLLLLALLLVSISSTDKTICPRALEVTERFRLKAYLTLDIIDPIKRALARGVIQPQIYNPIIG